MENVGIVYGHLEYIKAIWYILWALVNLVLIWYILHRFGILCQEKSGNPGTGLKLECLKFVTCQLSSVLPRN
jgi:hypothetical protein